MALPYWLHQASKGPIQGQRSTDIAEFQTAGPGASSCYTVSTTLYNVQQPSATDCNASGQTVEYSFPQSNCCLRNNTTYYVDGTGAYRVVANGVPGDPGIGAEDAQTIVNCLVVASASSPSTNGITISYSTNAYGSGQEGYVTQRTLTPSVLQTSGSCSGINQCGASAGCA